jgi:flavodoxin
MNSLVIYATRFGNTRAVAEAIADGLRTAGRVTLASAAEAPTVLPSETDLVVVGAPTEVHRMAPSAAEFFTRMAPGALQDVRAVAFDTRLHWNRWLSGSAATDIARKLKRRGANLVADPVSFFVDGSPAVLLTGELARAQAWGVALAKQLAAQTPVAAS